MDQVELLQKNIQDIRDMRKRVSPEEWTKRWSPRLFKLQDRLFHLLARRGRTPKIISLADLQTDRLPNVDEWLLEYLRSKPKHEVRGGYVCPAGAEHVDVILKDAAASGYSRRSIKQARIEVGADVKHIPSSKLWMWCVEVPANERIVTVFFPGVARAMDWLEKWLAQGDRHALSSDEIKRFTPEQVEYAKKKLGVREYRDQEGVLTWSLN